jgi:hypothetical protein
MNRRRQWVAILVDECRMSLTSGLFDETLLMLERLYYGRRGKTVKQALHIRLRQYANEFGLMKEDGNPNEQGIEEVAKIANWDTKGDGTILRLPPPESARFGWRRYTMRSPPEYFRG